jgi:hypothetical protein
MNDNIILNFFKNTIDYFKSNDKKIENYELKKLKFKKQEIDEEIKQITEKESGFDRIKELFIHKYYFKK